MMNLAIVLIVGILIGMIVLGLIVKSVMSKKMIVEFKSNKSFDETCNALEKAVEEFKSEGWGQPIERWHFYKVLENKNQIPKGIKNKMIYFICNPEMANKVITGDRKMSAMMPCSWSVYETTEGEVFVAKMNIGLMSMLFSGIIKETMKKVEEADMAMMPKVIK
jgi:uncharacterized protein (DUF302 family)